MTNNDDFDNQHEFSPTEELPPPKGMRGNLAEAWRSRPLFKLVVLMTAVAAIVAASVSFFGGGSTTTTSHVSNPPSISAPPGGPASPYMQQQTNLANQDREKQALATGGSALPTPIGASTDVGDMNGKKTDSLSELRAEVDRMRQDQKQQVQQTQGQPGQPNQRPEQFDDSLAQAMQKQLTQLTDSWTPKGVKEVTVTSNDVAKGGPGTPEAAAAQAAANQPPLPKTLVMAGTVSYAQLLTEANSDVPGPILAQILSGPFAGARAVGQFQISSGFADYLVLQFTLVNFKGKDYPINAIALDPDTTLGGMATEVNQRYLTRVVLPAAAGFIQGFGSAIGQGSSSITSTGTTTIVTQSGQGIHQGIYQGIGQAAQTAGEFFQNQANQVKPLVRVAAGTAMGMFFVSSVTDTTLQQLQQQQQLAAANGYPGSLGYPGGLGTGLPYGAASPYGTAGSYPGVAGVSGYPTGAYPGTTVAGYGASTGTNNLPYPNYSAPQTRTFSPYSALPSTGVGTGVYGQ